LRFRPLLLCRGSPCRFPERAGGEADALLEELAEVRGVVEAKLVGALHGGQVAVSERPLSLHDELLGACPTLADGAL